MDKLNEWMGVCVRVATYRLNNIVVRIIFKRLIAILVECVYEWYFLFKQLSSSLTLLVSEMYSLGLSFV